MKFARTFALFASIALMFTACDKGTEEVAVVKEPANPLLVYVPADTPVVFANLEPVPEAITDAYIDRFQPMIDEMNAEIAKFQESYAAGDFEDEPMAHLASAVLDELGGGFSVEALENLGISLQSHKVMYTMGAFPVVRLELADAAKLRAAIERVGAKMGVSLPARELNGVSYWHASDADVPVGVYIAIFDNQLALSMFPVTAEADLLPAFLGQEMPANSMATGNKLAALNKEKGYSAYGSGIVDIQKLADEVLSSDSQTRSYLGPEVSAELDALDAVCVAEVKAMIAKAPRMTMGTTRLTANEMAMSYELELENSLAAGLAALVTNVPAASEGDNLFSASLALQVGKLRNFVLEKANEVLAAPYQCPQLQELNADAQQMVTQLNIPMPPMVNNLEGLRVRMDDFDPAAGLNQGSGLLALHVDKPEMFVGMASMMVPGFDTLDLANQSEPVRIPETMIPMPELEVYALMGKRSIGAAVGGQFAAELKSFMETKSANDGTFLSVSYDMARQMELQKALGDFTPMEDGDHSSATYEFAESMRDSYMQALGRSRMDMRFTTTGLQIDSVVTFK